MIIDCFLRHKLYLIKIQEILAIHGSEYSQCAAPMGWVGASTAAAPSGAQYRHRALCGVREGRAGDSGAESRARRAKTGREEPGGWRMSAGDGEEGDCSIFSPWRQPQSVPRCCGEAPRF